MLESLRSGASSWVAKALLGLLVISFAVWGIGSDFVSGFGSQSLIEVGGTDISPYEYERAYRRELDNLRARLGGQIDADMANRLGLQDVTIDRLVQGAVLDESVRRMGLDVSDEAVRDRIVADPAFRGVNGQFDENTFRSRLYQAGLNEQAFIMDTRRAMVRGYLLQSIIAGAETAPNAIASPINQYREERRVAEFFEVLNGSVIDVPAPADNDLQTYYDENISRYTNPEFRGLTAVFLSPEQLAESISIGDDQITSVYEQRIEGYRTPASRTLDQLLFLDEESAKAAHEKIKAGETFVKIGEQELGLSAGDISLGKVVKRDLPTQIADAVFALGAGAVSEPLQSDLGWHIFSVKAATEETVKALTEVKDDIRNELALQKASDELYELSANLEDELAGGATLEEAAGKIDVKPIVIAAVDRNGLDAKRSRVAGLPEAREFLATAFATEDGEESQLTETRSNAFFIVRVDKIIEAAPRPLADVRDQVTNDWNAAQRNTRAGERAKALADEISAGKEVAEVAGSDGSKSTVSKPFTRTGTDAAAEFSTAAIAALFEARPGSAISAPNAAGTGHIVAKLSLVKKAAGAANDTVMERQAEDLGRDIAGDLLQAYQQALRDDLGVTVNRQLLSNFQF